LDETLMDNEDKSSGWLDRAERILSCTASLIAIVGAIAGVAYSLVAVPDGPSSRMQVSGRIVTAEVSAPSDDALFFQHDTMKPVWNISQLTLIGANILFIVAGLAYVRSARGGKAPDKLIELIMGGLGLFAVTLTPIHLIGVGALSVDGGYGFSNGFAIRTGVLIVAFAGAVPVALRVRAATRARRWRGDLGAETVAAS
jgi:hypothetical protein